MRTLITMSVVVATLALGACATRAPEATAAGEAAKPTQMAGEASLNGPVQTGTRMPKRGTERNVRTVGNKAYREDEQIRSLGNDVGMRGN